MAGKTKKQESTRVVKDKPVEKQPKPPTGVFKDRLVYVGPTLGPAGLVRGTVFGKGKHPKLEKIFSECPDAEKLFVPPKLAASALQSMDWALPIANKILKLYRKEQ